MPFTLMIQADNLAIAQAALAGVVRALAEETVPDQAELRFEPASDTTVVIPRKEVEAALQIAEPEQKKRGRKPREVPVPVEDVEPTAATLTQEEEPEAEGAVDTEEPDKAAAGVTEAQLRDKVREIMDKHDMQTAINRLKKAGYRAVKEVPPEDYDRVYKQISAA